MNGLTALSPSARVISSLTERSVTSLPERKAELAGRAPAFAYLGIAAELVDSVLERAKVTLAETPVETTP